jgi:hypothetical protein
MMVERKSWDLKANHIHTALSTDLLEDRTTTVNPSPGLAVDAFGGTDGSICSKDLVKFYVMAALLMEFPLSHYFAIMKIPQLMPKRGIRSSSFSAPTR